MEHEEAGGGLAAILDALVRVTRQIDKTKNKKAVEYLLQAMALAVSVGGQEEQVETNAIGFLAEFPEEEDLHEEIEE